LFLVQGGKLNFSGRWLDKLKTLVKLPIGFLESVAFILQKKPAYVLGVGGYASGPFVLAASILGYPTGIWEPNAQPGLANRWLSRFVRECFLVFEEGRDQLHAKKFLVEGMPVRKEIDAAFAEASARKPGLSTEASANAEPLKILCFGGSLGSRVINNALVDGISQKLDYGSTHLIHQIGSTDWKIFSERYRGLDGGPTFKAEPMEFIFDMPKYYRWADIAVCRGGASTLAEVAAFGVPPIVIPLPAADGHQEKNAEALRAAGAAVIIPQRELTPARLQQEIARLRNNPELRAEMRKNLQKFFRPQAARHIAQAMLAGD
jgi:UDP-N-acetylglucosamine--N-acetylmuramyl-(pentapeptide) pyrophosphoryl-undecaprenol N-acetylglucosamine transferase